MIRVVWMDMRRNRSVGSQIMTHIGNVIIIPPCLAGKSFTHLYLYIFTLSSRPQKMPKKLQQSKEKKTRQPVPTSGLSHISLS